MLRFRDHPSAVPPAGERTARPCEWHLAMVGGGAKCGRATYESPIAARQANIAGLLLNRLSALLRAFDCPFFNRRGRRLCSSWLSDGANESPLRSGHALEDLDAPLHPLCRDEITGVKREQITSAPFAVQRQIEKRQATAFACDLQPDGYSPKHAAAWAPAWLRLACAGVASVYGR